MRNNVLFVLALIVVVGLGSGLYGCVGPDGPGPFLNNSNGSANNADGDAPAYPTNHSDLASANNQFAFDLYSKYRSDDGNLFFSPWSISSAMAMAYDGARGQTATEIQHVFHFPSNTSLLEAEYASANGQINKPDKSYTLWNANSLWVEQTYPLNSDYADRMQTYFDGQAAPLDFKQSPEESRATINGWVENKTNDRIKGLLPPGSIQPLTRLVLANAIYMKADWSIKFERKDTREEDFQLGSGQKIKTAMMRTRDTFNYGETSDFQIIELPYGDGNLSMLVLLPKQGVVEGLMGGKLEATENSLTPQNLDQWKSGMVREDVALSLPKFKFEKSYALSDDLKDMGMPVAFTDSADFNGIGPEGLAISEVYHKAFVAVDENGTEAAAATAMTLAATAVNPNTPQPQPKVFNADHPFIFIVQEKSTGNVIFLGRVSDPTAG